MSKFKVGDRVVCLDPRYTTFGKEGTVRRAAEGLILVAAEGHPCPLPYERHEINHVSNALTVDSAVSLYTLACERYEAAQLELDRAKDAVHDARLVLRDALDADQ